MLEKSAAVSASAAELTIWRRQRHSMRMDDLGTFRGFPCGVGIIISCYS